MHTHTLFNTIVVAIFATFIGFGTACALWWSFLVHNMTNWNPSILIGSSYPSLCAQTYTHQPQFPQVSLFSRMRLSRSTTRSARDIYNYRRHIYNEKRRRMMPEWAAWDWIAQPYHIYNSADREASRPLGCLQCLVISEGHGGENNEKPINCIEAREMSYWEACISIHSFIMIRWWLWS